MAWGVSVDQDSVMINTKAHYVHFWERNEGFLLSREQNEALCDTAAMLNL